MRIHIIFATDIGVNELDNEFEKMDFIDSLSERHLELRKKLEQLWNDASQIPLSNSEWFIIAKIYKKKPTIADVSKKLNITRQATHKFIKSLEAKGLVIISNVEHDKRVKSIHLTPLGEECYEKHKVLKENLEYKISKHIGIENHKLLKEILKMDWGLND